MHLLARDYYQEVLACLDVCLPNWNVKHLSLWSELVEPETLVVAESEPDLEAMEEVTAQAVFQETVSKIAFLEQIIGSFCCFFENFAGRGLWIFSQRLPSEA